jgi:hypothetical protein
MGEAVKSVSRGLAWIALICVVMYSRGVDPRDVAASIIRGVATQAAKVVSPVLGWADDRRSEVPDIDARLRQAARERELKEQRPPAGR